MNKTLTTQIIKHIFSNLGIIDKRASSLIDERFLIDLKIEYETTDDYGDPYAANANVWVAEGSNNDVKITLACVKFDVNVDETAVIIKIENCPIYGCYLESVFEESGLIAFSLKDNIWMETDIHTQALFLAGMESFKDLSVNFGACKNPTDIYDTLISFVEWRDNNE